MASVHKSVFENPAYWRKQAEAERAFAEEDRRRRGGSVESIRVHEQNAENYEAYARKLEKGVE